MSHQNEIQEEIAIHTRRLHELKKKAAYKGVSTEPHISMEIKDIEEKIKQLQKQLETIKGQTTPISSIRPTSIFASNFFTSMFALIITVVIGIILVYIFQNFIRPSSPVDTNVIIQVFDKEDGKSIPNATVLLFFEGSRLISETDTTGTAQFQVAFSANSANVDLVVEADDYKIERFNNVKLQNGKLDVSLSKVEGSESSIITLVTNERGASIFNAEVILLVRGNIYSQPTDSNGIAKFTITFFDSSVDAQIKVSTEGYETDSQNVTLLPDQVQHIRLNTLEKSLEILDTIEPQSASSSLPPPPPPPTPTNARTPTSTSTDTPTPTSTFTSTPIPPTPTPLGGGGQIIFVSNRDGNEEIYIMNIDGSEQKNLTRHFANDTIPAWSPDGKRITFETNRDGNWEIYIMNADGSEQKRLTNNNFEDHDPDWSPDGKKIVFHSNRSDGIWRIWAMDVEDDFHQESLTDNPNGDWAASWSPDGKRIAFASDFVTGKGEIYMMNSDGSNLVNLTQNSARDSVPHWSPDGSKIAFYSERDGNREIYVMMANGENQERLTNNSSRDFLGTWSPDGKHIVFTSERDGDQEIYRMRVDGTELTRLTTNPANDFNPVWSPQ